MTDFNEIINRRDSDSIKWNFFASDVLPLWVADTDFRSPPQVIEALHSRIDHGIFGYANIPVSSREAVQKWLRVRHGWDVSLDDILLLPGIVLGFNLAARVYSNPGDSILIQTPAYHPFFDVSRNNQLIQVQVPLGMRHDGYYEINWDDIDDAILPTTRIFMLCNPHNPTGRVFSKGELLRLADLCLDRNILICSDEIHCDLIYSGYRHIPIASLSREIACSTVTLISPSKTFNLAGLYASAAIIPNPNLRERFQKGMEAVGASANLLGECAMTAAYSHGAPWLDRMLSYLENNRSILCDFVTNQLPGISIYPPESTFLGWLDCRGIDQSNPADYFIRRAKVALNSGSWFGEHFGSFARINFGCPTSILLQALERIKSSLTGT